MEALLGFEFAPEAGGQCIHDLVVFLLLAKDLRVELINLLLQFLRVIVDEDWFDVLAVKAREVAATGFGLHLLMLALVWMHHGVSEGAVSSVFDELECVGDGVLILFRLSKEAELKHTEDAAENDSGEDH